MSDERQRTAEAPMSTVVTALAALLGMTYREDISGEAGDLIKELVHEARTAYDAERLRRNEAPKIGGTGCVDCGKVARCGRCNLAVLERQCAAAEQRRPDAMPMTGHGVMTSLVCLLGVAHREDVSGEAGDLIMEYVADAKAAHERCLRAAERLSPGEAQPTETVQNVLKELSDDEVDAKIAGESDDRETISGIIEQRTNDASGKRWVGVVDDIVEYIAAVRRYGRLDAAREELTFIVSYLAHNDQDANHAWMVRRIRAVLAGNDPATVEPWSQFDGVRQRRESAQPRPRCRKCGATDSEKDPGAHLSLCLDAVACADRKSVSDAAAALDATDPDPQIRAAARAAGRCRLHLLEARPTVASCELHALTAEGHCEEMERMLEHVPGDMLEGDGDTPADAIERLRGAYEAAEDEIESLRSMLLELVMWKCVTVEKALSLPRTNIWHRAALTIPEDAGGDAQPEGEAER